MDSSRDPGNNMSVPSEVFEDLHDDNQKTSAYGWSPRVAATQNGSWNPVLNAVVQLSSRFGSNGTVDDAHNWAFRDIRQTNINSGETVCRLPN